MDALKAAYSLGQTFCTAHNDIYKGAYEMEKQLVKERERVQVLEERLAEETAIVDRVWKALGISTYEQADGKAIDEIVASLRTKAALTEDSHGG